MLAWRGNLKLMETEMQTDVATSTKYLGPGCYEVAGDVAYVEKHTNASFEGGHLFKVVDMQERTAFMEPWLFEERAGRKLL